MPISGESNRTPPVKAVDRTCRIIFTLNELNGARVTELANELEMGKSTIYKHLNTLEKQGLVLREGNIYRLSLRFFSIGRSVQTTNIVYTCGRETINHLAEQSKEYSHLFTIEGGQAICLHMSRGELAVGNDIDIGEYSHLHHIAAGKVMLAHLSKQEVDQIVDKRGLPQRTENTITDRDELFQELAEIRDRGYSLNIEEEMAGIHAVGAPILDISDNVIGGLSISGPTNRLDATRVNDFIEYVQYGRNIIELSIHETLKSRNRTR